MRIAITSLYLPGGSKIGVGYQVHHFANRLESRGHEVVVLSPDAPGEGARYEHVPVDPGRSLRTFRFAWRLRDLDLESFDILHAHGDDHFLAGRPRPPHVRTVHGSCFAEARHVPGVKEKVRMGLLGCGEVASTFVADRTYGVSEATRRVYPWIDGVIPNGVDTSSGVQGRTPTAEPSILFVGTYRNRKRGWLLAEHFQRFVRPVLPDSRLLMVCADAPAMPGVEVLGRVGDSELSALYRSAWAFCLPSTYEGFGVPYVEAMAAGCPVVATPNPGAREVTGEGTYGQLVHDSGLGPALLSLLLDPARRSRLADAGRRRAEEFSWDRVLDRYETVYADLLSHPDPHR